VDRPPAAAPQGARERYDGGLNVFRQRYRVREPLRLHSTDSGLHDEVALYGAMRARPDTPPADDGLRILLVGELAFNPERVLALEERGHTLLGLWTDRPLGAQTVGPLPFGTSPTCLTSRRRGRCGPTSSTGCSTGAPCRSPPRAPGPARGARSCGTSRRRRRRASAAAPGPSWSTCAPGRRGAVRDGGGARLDGPRAARTARPARTGVLDGDLPKADWFTDDALPRLSDQDGQVHTVVLGRSSRSRHAPGRPWRRADVPRAT
jgi:hypothetical protein